MSLRNFAADWRDLVLSSPPFFDLTRCITLPSMEKATRSTKPVYWLLVPVLLSISLGSFWAAGFYGPIGKPGTPAASCSDLRTFITSEEVPGKAKWQEYRDLVTQLSALSNSAPERPGIIQKIAGTMIDVLGHDLAIYKEMNRSISCVLMDKRGEISKMITDTEDAINFLNGSKAIDGNFFDPELGTWNSNYYSEYLSALDMLKGSGSSS